MISSYILKILKTPTKTVRTNKFSEVVGYNINIQKAAVFLYTNNELSHQKIKHNPFYRPLWWHSRQESACQCMGHGFNSWSAKIPHAAKQLSPVPHSFWAHEPQLLSLCAATTKAHGPRACALQEERSPKWEDHTPQWRVAPTCRTQLEKARTEQWRPGATKENTKTNKNPLTIASEIINT